MLNLEREFVQLRDSARISPALAESLIAQERREVLSVRKQLRILSLCGVLLIVAGASIFIAHNLQRIGPLAIAGVIGAASLACYAYSVRRRGTQQAGFVLLLGALLLSIDLGYIEHQFHTLGSEWTAHFVLLALIHGLTAYYFDSAALLGLAIASLACFFGVERNIGTFFTNSTGTSLREFACAAFVGVWRYFNRRARFQRVFDHFFANLILSGGLILTFYKDTRLAGTLVVVIASALVIAYGFRERREAFVIYAYVYAVIAVTVLVVTNVNQDKLASATVVIAMIAAIAGLGLLHARFKAVAG